MSLGTGSVARSPFLFLFGGADFFFEFSSSMPVDW